MDDREAGQGSETGVIVLGAGAAGLACAGVLDAAGVPVTILEARDLVPANIAPELYLRVLANPFLGFAGLVGWLLAARWAVGLLRKSPELIGPLSPILVALFLAALALIPGLFHVHCLDCGATLRMSRWRWHACATSALRRVSGRTRWLRGPSRVSLPTARKPPPTGRPRATPCHHPARSAKA